MITGFKAFILRGNVVELAVAVVIGAAFTAVVNAIITNVFTPLLGAVFNAKSLDDAFTLVVGDAHIRLGAVAGSLIQFLLVAVVVYVAFVYPINRAKERAEARRGGSEQPAPTEVELLADIRAILQDRPEVMDHR